jgi:YARHG domain
MPKLRLVLLLAGALAGSHAAWTQPAGDSKDRPLYYTREITQQDLEGRSLRELSLMRNTIYARAGNKFRKKWLNDYFSAQPWYQPQEPMDESKITPLDRKNAETIATYDAALTHDQLFAIQNDLIMGGASTPEQKLELRLLSARLGKWKGADTDADRTPLEDPTLLDKQLTVDQLKDFSRRDLRMLRNLIYARRGRPFHSDLLRSYFQSVDWYKPDDKYTDARLTPLDKRNINLILSVENSLGGPLTDYQHKKEDGWFVRA